jgi:shikimate dehydrogenase
MRSPPEMRSRPEVGGRLGPDPTRYGDWELRGRCIDF